MFQGSLKSVSRKFKRCFKEGSCAFQGSFKGGSRKFKGCFQEVLREFQKSFHVVSVMSPPREI